MKYIIYIDNDGQYSDYEMRNICTAPTEAAAAKIVAAINDWMKLFDSVGKIRENCRKSYKEMIQLVGKPPVPMVENEDDFDGGGNGNMMNGYHCGFYNYEAHFMLVPEYSEETP